MDIEMEITDQDIDIENDDRPPSVLNKLIKDSVLDSPFSSIPPLPLSYKNKDLAEWLKNTNSLYSKDRLPYCVLMYTFSNGGSFTMESVPKSFKHRDLPKELDEDLWIRSFQYVAKMMELDRGLMSYDQIEKAADKLLSTDDEERGPFLNKSTDGEYSFLDPLIADAVGLSYCYRRKDRGLSLAGPVFIYRYCMTYAQFSRLDDYDVRKVMVFISRDFDEYTMFEIFMEEICKGNVYDTISNRMFDDEGFCSNFFRHLKRMKKSADMEKSLFTAVDIRSTENSPKTFLYCAIAQPTPKQFLLTPAIEFTAKYHDKNFIEIQYKLLIEFCCRTRHMEIYLRLAPNVTTFPFKFIRSAIVGGDSILLDRVLSHQSWNQNQSNKAMQWIAMTGKFDDYLRIKQAGARPDNITLYEGIMGRSTEIFEDIIRDGISCNDVVYQGRKAIHAAAEIGSFDIMDMLIQRGANIETKTERGELPLHIAIDNYHDDLAEHLLMRGADASQCDYRGATAILRACARGLYRLIERLMYVGADVTDVDSLGCNILHKAYLSGEEEVIRFAKSHGFKIDSLDKNNNSVLHYAALSGNLKHLKDVLDQMPAMISACNTSLWNPASCAAFGGQKDVFMFLKRNGTNLQQNTSDGKSILDLAIQGQRLRREHKSVYMEEFQETLRLGSLDDYENIIQSFQI